MVGKTISHYKLWAEASGKVVAMTPNEVEVSLGVAFGKSSI